MTSLSSSCCPVTSSPFYHQHNTSPMTCTEEASLTRAKRERDYEHELALAHLRRQRQAVISCIACVLHQLFDHRCDELDPERLTMFHTEKKPSISVRAYFERIAKYGDCSTEALIFSLIHINRIMHQKPNFEITSLNIHRLLLTSIMCSAKFFDDHYFNNTYYSKIGGVPPHEMNSLEIEFLALINFDLAIDPAMFHQFESELCNPELHQECDCYYWQIQLQDMKQVMATMQEMNQERPYYQVLAPDGKSLLDLRKQTTSSTPMTTAPIITTSVPVIITSAPVTVPIQPTTTQQHPAVTKPKSDHPSPVVTAVSCDTHDTCHMSISPSLHMSPSSACSSTNSSTHSSGSLSMSTSSTLSSSDSSRAESPNHMSPLATTTTRHTPRTQQNSCTTSPIPYDDDPITCPLPNMTKHLDHHVIQPQLVQAAR